jgi:hypothetical protein
MECSFGLTGESTQTPSHPTRIPFILPTTQMRWSSPRSLAE